MQEILITIISQGQVIGHVGYDEEMLIVTEGLIGENTYKHWTEMLKGLQGHGISIDDLYF